MIIRAPIVVTMDGAPIVDGAVAVRDDKIADVGKWREVRARNAGEVLDLDGRVLMPGLINAHCHLDYTDLRDAVLAGGSFTDWIRAINQRKSDWEPEDYVRSIRRGLDGAARFGATTVVAFEAFPELIAKVLPAPLRTWWLAEMIDVRMPVSARDVFEKLCEVTKGDSLSAAGLAPHAPFTASKELYREASSICAERGAIFSTHLAESRDEMRMFREADGPLFQFLRGLGRPTEDCGTATPLELLLRYGTIDEHSLIAHLNELTEGDRKLLENAPKFSVVHCPRSHVFFGHADFPLQLLRRFGFNLCLGTDSLASNTDLSLFAEMRRLARTEPALPARDLVEMVTVNAARALGQANAIGRVASGAFADLIALPCSGEIDEIYREIVDFNGTQPWTMIAGRFRENA